jgi:hypothetical protein
MRFSAVAAGVALAVAMGEAADAQIVLPAAAPQPVMLAPAGADPVKIDLARRLVAASGGEQQAEAQIRATMAAMQTAMARAMPQADERLMGPLYEDMTQEMVKVMPQVLDLSARAYAETFTEQELRDVLAFQTSESGRSMIRKMPQIRARLIAEAVPLMVNAMPAIMRRTLDRVCAEQHCTTRQREVMASAAAKALNRPAI